MIDLEEYKRILGPLAEELTEEQILKLRDQQDQMAEIFFAMWLEQIKAKENKV